MSGLGIVGEGWGHVVRIGQRGRHAGMLGFLGEGFGVLFKGNGSI